MRGATKTLREDITDMERNKIIKQILTVEMDDAMPDMVTANALYIRDMDGVDLLFAEEGTKLTANHINKLKEHRVKELTIFTYILPPSSLTEEVPDEEPQDDLVEMPQKYEETLPEVVPVISNELRDKTINSIQNLFSIAKDANESNDNMTTAYQAVKDLDDVVHQLINAITLDTRGLIHINNLKSYDEYTYHHSLSVAVLAVAIGQELNLGRDDLTQLCRCALLHDIGKMFIPVELITNPGRLKPDEFDIIKTHAMEGGKHLKNGVISGLNILLGVMYHHEKYDGSGYPKGLSKDQIPMFGRIIAVADVYDAVTSFRSYREPMAPCNALDMIVSEAGTAFDPEVVEAFKHKLELYPVNTIVELSDKRIGIVIDNTAARRPILRMLDNGELMNLSDLDHLNLTIMRVIKREELSV